MQLPFRNLLEVKLADLLKEEIPFKEHPNKKQKNQKQLLTQQFSQKI